MPGSPSLLDAQSREVLTRLNELYAFMGTQVKSGGVITDGGTTQATGANGAFNLDLDTTIAEVVISNIPQHEPAGTDIDATGGAAVLWGATSGVELTCAVVLHTGTAGTTASAYDTVCGAVAATGLSVAPTEAQIDTALGHSNWVLVGDVVFARTADTTVTVTASYARRASLGGKVTAAGGAANRLRPLAITDEDFRDYGGSIGG